MEVLVIRHDADGTVSWKTYDRYPDSTPYSLLDDIEAHLNTVGVSRIEIIPEAQ